VNQGGLITLWQLTIQRHSLGKSYEGVETTNREQLQLLLRPDLLLFEAPFLQNCCWTQLRGGHRERRGAQPRISKTVSPKKHALYTWSGTRRYLRSTPTRRGCEPKFTCGWSSHALLDRRRTLGQRARYNHAPTGALPCTFPAISHFCGTLPFSALASVPSRGGPHGRIFRNILKTIPPPVDNISTFFPLSPWLCQSFKLFSLTLQSPRFQQT
jgi:hypothetical protein